MKLHHHEKFDGISALMQVITDRKARESRDGSGYDGGPRWSAQTLAQATAIANDGGADFDTADKMLTVKNLTDAAMADAIYMPNWTPSVAGFLPNVGAYCAGQPLAMYSQDESVLEAAKVIKIVVTCIPCASVSADAMLNRGAALLGAIDALERDGNTRVELVGTFPSFDRSGQNCLLEVALKSAGDDWNPASVAFAIANPAFGRRIGFKWLESKPEYADNVEAAYGNGRTPDGKSPIPCDIYLPYLDHDSGYESPKHAVKSVSDIFNAQLKQLTDAA